MEQTRVVKDYDATLAMPARGSRCGPRQAGRVAVVCSVDISVKALLMPQIDAMRQSGYDVTVVCSDGDYVPSLRKIGLTVETVPISRSLSPAADLLALWRLFRLFRQERFDLVHTHTPKATFLAQWAAWLAGVPVRVNTIHGFYYPALPLGVQRKIFKAMEVSACRLASHVFSQSQEDIDTAIRERLIPPRRLEWLGNGIDLQCFSRDAFPADMRQRVREELAIPADAFVVGIVARMVREKGLAELFKAVAMVRQAGHDVYLLHVGFVDRSRGEEVTPELAESLNISLYCHFAGQRDDVARIMTGMDIYCLPSHREGYPRSVMEANAMGLPAIVTDIRGCREAVVHGDNGLIVPVRDPQALADSIVRLKSDAELRCRLSEGARRRAAEAFDERRVIDVILSRYQLLLRRRQERRV